MVQQKYDPIESISITKYGWIILLVLQGIYLTLDVVELSGVHRISYGLLSAIFMFFLGVTILIFSLINIKEKSLHGFIEGGFYLIFAAIIFYYKYQHYDKFKSTEKDLETTTKQYNKLQDYNIQLQSMNQRLENINKQMAVHMLKSN